MTPYRSIQFRLDGFYCHVSKMLTGDWWWSITLDQPPVSRPTAARGVARTKADAIAAARAAVKEATETVLI